MAHSYRLRQNASNKSFGVYATSGVLAIGDAEKKAREDYSHMKLDVVYNTAVTFAHQYHSHYSKSDRKLSMGCQLPP